MVLSDTSTIVAEATPLGRGGVGIVRISGPNAAQIAEKILGKLPKPRAAEYLPFQGENQELIDHGLALFFKGPNSFTGEDVLELHGHGGPFVMQRLLKAAMHFGARLANPGEFSLRAFLNNKIDLLQAEAIADLINSSSEQAAKYAVRSLQGDFSKLVHDWIESLIKLRMFVEAAIDFPEEELDFLSDGRLQTQVSTLLLQMQDVINASQQGALLSEGIRVVIAGKPNAGKSSLLNRLSGKDAAIVTDIPGTTRDVLREHISIDGLLLQLIDTAGLRQAGDVVEEQGIKRAHQEIQEADHVLWVVDALSSEEMHFKELLSDYGRKVSAKHYTILYNKIDTLEQSARIENEDEYSKVYLSAKTGEGIELLRERIKQAAGFNLNGSESIFIARTRHLEALKNAQQHLQTGLYQLTEFKAGELLAEELRVAQQSLEEITGKFTSDDLLGRIFSEFCIGK